MHVRASSATVLVVGQAKTTDELVTTRDVALLCGVAIGTVNRWVREGRLVPVIVGNGPTGTRFYRRVDAEELA